jgi:cytochrome c biogenesis protein CcmG, thiol:disulfide interchange protein DsbE
MNEMIRRRKISRLALPIGCALFLALAPAAGGSQHHLTGQSSAPVPGSPAISFELKSLEGKPVTLTNFRGKSLVMNFFASWCDPCRDEMPLINELAAKSDKDSYSVLGIAVEDTRAAVTEFAKETKLVFPIALDLNSTVKRAYRIFGPPATFFIDGQGIIRDVVLGPLTAERAREAMKRIGTTK